MCALYIETKNGGIIYPEPRQILCHQIHKPFRSNAANKNHYHNPKYNDFEFRASMSPKYVNTEKYHSL